MMHNPQDQEQIDILALSQSLNQEPSPQQKECSQKIQYNLSKKCEEKQGGMQCFEDIPAPEQKEIIAHSIANIQKKQGFSVIFKQNSDGKTHNTMRILASDLHLNTLRITETINISQTTFKKQQMKDDQKKKEQFKEWYKKRCREMFKMTQKGIGKIQLSLTQKENQIKVTWITDQGLKISNALKKVQLKIQIHKVFEKLHFSTSDYFDIQGNINFLKDGLGAIFQRGRWPYFQPNFGKRYGLNINKYEKSKTWIGNTGQEGQWACAYHGVRNAMDKHQRSKTSCLQNILKEDLKPGDRQAYSGKKAVNKDEEIDKGTYFTPYLQTALAYAARVEIKDDKAYYVILQCRLKPQSILVCPNRQDYWVVKNPQDIRCYGVILLDQSQAKHMPPKIQQTHGESFSYEKFKTQIQCKWNQMKWD